MKQREMQLDTRIIIFFRSIRPYLQVLWTARKKLVIINGIAAILILAYLLIFLKPTYECSVRILPDYGNKSSSLIGQLGDLASLAGVTMGENSQAMYQELIRSESVLLPVICARYKSGDFKDSVNLLQYFGIEYDKSLPTEMQERGAFLKLYRLISKSILKTTLDRDTRILTVKVTMSDGKLCAAVVNQLVASLDKYVRTERKSNAFNERSYLEIRVKEVKDSLKVAEEKLRNFRNENKVLNQSAELLMEQGRLSRSVDFLENVYLKLAQQLELTRLDEIRDTPVLNIEESAKDPITPSSFPRRYIFLFLFFLSSVLSATYVLTFPSVDKIWRAIWVE